MTTIAFKDNILAADTQLTDDDVKLVSSDKISILNKYTLFAAAGDVSAIIIAERFFRQEDWEARLHERPELQKPKSLDAILIFKGLAYHLDRDLVPDVLKHPFYSVGSGWKFAMAGMHQGMSAVDAVKFASEFDIYTNNKVKWINVKEFQEGSQKKSRGAKRASSVEVKEEEAGTKSV